MTSEFANAFNEISRATVREQLALHFLSLFSYFDLRSRHHSSFFELLVHEKEFGKVTDPSSLVSASVGFFQAIIRDESKVSLTL